jgi:hypothetical protein
LLLDTELGPGVVHDRDLDALVSRLVDAQNQPLSAAAMAEALDSLQAGRAAGLHLLTGDGAVTVAPLRAAEAASRFGYVQQPRQPAGEAECH